MLLKLTVMWLHYFFPKTCKMKKRELLFRISRINLLHRLVDSLTYNFWLNKCYSEGIVQCIYFSDWHLSLFIIICYTLSYCNMHYCTLLLMSYINAHFWFYEDKCRFSIGNYLLQISCLVKSTTRQSMWGSTWWQKCYPTLKPQRR